MRRLKKRNVGTPAKRRLHRAWYKAYRLEWSCLERGEMQYSDLALPPYPQELIGMECGAKTRRGHPCRISDLYANGRCKFHGGLSTGPKTKRGKARSARNGFLPKRDTNPMRR